MKWNSQCLEKFERREGVKLECMVCWFGILIYDRVEKVAACVEKNAWINKLAWWKFIIKKNLFHKPLFPCDCALFTPLFSTTVPLSHSITALVKLIKHKTETWSEIPALFRSSTVLTRPIRSPCKSKFASLEWWRALLCLIELYISNHIVTWKVTKPLLRKNEVNLRKFLIMINQLGGDS